ncbi:SAM-dependent methyltransferase, partial [Salmonella enterica subsp. enterica serovar Infantis]
SLHMVNNAMLVTNNVITDILSLKFRSWLTRMRTPAPLDEAIRLYKASAPVEVNRYYELQDYGTFSSDTKM